MGQEWMVDQEGLNLGYYFLLYCIRVVSRHFKNFSTNQGPDGMTIALIPPIRAPLTNSIYFVTIGTGGSHLTSCL
jgi:hypothetical protein